MHGDRAKQNQPHGTLKSTLTGFLLSVVLTAIPFALVMRPGFSHGAIVAAIFAMAVVQILVHLYYFLHLDAAPEQRWNLIAFVFTALIVVILVGGSVWIMINIANHMMVP